MKKHLLFSSALALASLSVSSVTAQNALSLNGSYVDCGTDALLSPSNIKTLECWVKFDNLTGSQEILSRSIAGTGIELLLYSNNLAFYCMNGTAYSFISYPVASNIVAGTWYHVAATWDGSRANMRLYVNGVSVGTRTDSPADVSNALPATVAGSFRIGQWSTLTEDRSLKGTVDEVRIWSSMRTAAQIKSGMYANYSGGTPGLTAYYPLDETNGLTVNNTLGASILNGLMTPGTAGTYTRSVSPIRFASNAVNFGGTNDEIRVPANTKLDLTTGTIECWVRPSAFPSISNVPVNMALISNRGGGTGTNLNTRYSFHMTSNTLGLWNGLSYVAITVPAFTIGRWYHLAFVCDGSSTLYYIDGVLKGSSNNAFNTAVTGQPLVIGLAKFDNINDSRELYRGDMDDIRIWSRPRTQAEIAGSYTLPLSGSETDLVANYTFNTGISSGNNNGLQIALDATANNLHGTLMNFTLTGAASNYVNSGVVILPVQLINFTAIKTGPSNLLSWATAQEQNAKSFVVERSSDGIHFSPIGTVAAARNSTTTSNYSFTDDKPAGGTSYYRLQLTDADGKSSYSKTVAVKAPDATAVTVSPNPASSTLHYSFSSGQAAKISVSILSAAGQKVQQFSAAVQAGSNSLSVDVSRLPAGNYTLQLLSAPAGIASSQAFSIVR